MYKEHQNEIRTLIKKRDKEMEGILNYREKCWTETLDLINNNLIKIYFTKGEFEGTLNFIGHRQNELIKKISRSMEWSVLNKSGEGSRSRQPQVKIPEFSPSTTGYKLDLVNLPSSHRRKIRRK